MSGISNEQIKKIKRRLTMFSEGVSYQLNHNDIIIYINKIKNRYAPETFRKHVIDIRRFLKFLNVDFADRIKTPKSPKHRKIIIKRGDIVDILNQTEKLSEMQRLRLKAGILLSATSGLRAFELYSLTPDAIDVENRTIYLNANQTKDLEERVVFFNVEAMKALTEYIEKLNEEHDRLFALSTVEKNFRKLNTHLRMRHMRKFFSQQSDRLGMPTAIKKILMGHVISDDEYVFFTKSKDVDLGHYDFQDDEDLKKIYDRYWKDFRILG